MTRWKAIAVAVLVPALVSTVGVPASAGASRVGQLRQIDMERGPHSSVSVTDISDSGYILGRAEDADGVERPIVWRRECDQPITLAVPHESGMRINNRGDVHGGRWIWRDGQLSWFTHPAGQPMAEDFNDRGQVVGRVTAGAVTSFAFLWENGQAEALPTPASANSSARKINNRGEVIGSLVDFETGTTTAVRWWRGTTTVLRVPGRESVRAVDINDRGQILLNADDRAFIWDRGRVTDVMRDRPHATSAGRELTDTGYVLGTADDRPVLWHRGRTIPISSPTGSVQAFFVNDRGDVAGVVHNDLGHGSYGIRAFLWRQGKVYESVPNEGEEPYLAVLGMDRWGRIVGETDGGSIGHHDAVWRPASR